MVKVIPEVRFWTKYDTMLFQLFNVVYLLAVIYFYLMFQFWMENSCNLLNNIWVIGFYMLQF